MSGTITLAATPIGNLSDASQRVQELLKTADIIAAEDTRRTHQLLNALNISPTGSVVAYHEHNESTKTPQLLEAVQQGANLVMVTDAGMPGVSDPGYRLVSAAVEAGIEPTCAPGPSAPLVALTLSGLPTDKFCFEGFLPRKAGPRSQRLTALAADERTQIFFEAPHRLDSMLEALSQEFGADRQAAVCRELTKKFEQIRRGTLAQLIAQQQQDPARGEIVVVVAGAVAQSTELADVVEQALQSHNAGERLKTAAAAAAKEHGHSTRDVYQGALDILNDQKQMKHSSQ